MWDLIVSVPDHCLSFYFAWCYMCCSFHYISLYHIKMRIPGKSVSLIINFIANFRLRIIEMVPVLKKLKVWTLYSS